MPNVLYIKGWRLFFYSNEGTEPIYIHAQNGIHWSLIDEDLSIDGLLRVAQKIVAQEL